MSFFDQCKQCSVIVDNGSGVLFQPMTEEYSYILTAKHNLYNDVEHDSYDEPKNIDDIKLNGNNNQIKDKYEHQTLDIAILKIDKTEFESPYKEFKQPSDRDEFKFYGYPQNRRERAEQIKYFDLKVGHMSSYEIVAENDSYYNQNDVAGCSGGGVFKQDGNDFYLVGIECRMDAESDLEENNTRLRFIFIEAFDEIIEENELEPLYPVHMGGFDLISEHIFLLNDYESKRDFVRNRLKYLAKTYSKELSPITIKNEFENELFINGFDINNITDSELWQMYLEFILLSIIIESKENITIDKIKEIYKKRKILFAKADRWVDLKEEIVKSNLLGLQKNGTVFIACNGDRRPNKVQLSSNSIINITQPPQPEEMRIDQGIDYSVDIKYKHIYAIEKLLLDNEEEFVSTTGNNIDEILKKVLQNVCQ